MCGRFTLTANSQEISDVYGVSLTLELKPNYNIAPSQAVLAIRMAEPGHREAVYLRWGFIPAWMKAITTKFINARAETVSEKPLFRAAYKSRHCLIVASGFYEWQHIDDKKIPYYIHRKNHELLSFAGIWERWHGESGETIESCAIITTQANQALSSIHSRMPVIVEENNINAWLSGDRQTELLHPYPKEDLTLDPVSLFVNNPKHNSSECIAPRK